MWYFAVLLFCWFDGMPLCCFVVVLLSCVVVLLCCCVVDWWSRCVVASMFCGNVVLSLCWFVVLVRCCVVLLCCCVFGLCFFVVLLLFRFAVLWCFGVVDLLLRLCCWFAVP